MSLSATAATVVTVSTLLVPSGYTDIGLRHWMLAESGKFDRTGVLLADGHYSRRKPGSPQFMPPGQTIVLITRDFRSVWGWWRPHPRSGIKAMNGLDGWTCSIFRRTDGPRASDLVLDAELAIDALGYGCGPSGLLTYVWCSKIQSTNPGWCYQQAGYTKTGWSADGKKILLWKPARLAGIAACPVPVADSVPQSGDSMIHG